MFLVWIWPAHAFSPRNPVFARRALVVFTGVGAGMSMLFAVLFPTAATNNHPAVTIYACLITIGLAGALLAARHPAPWIWAAYPVASVAIIATLDLSSGDASLTAQVFFLFPMLYAGSQLRPRATAILWGLTTIADGLVNGLLTPAGDAVANTAFLSVALASAASVSRALRPTDRSAHRGTGTARCNRPSHRAADPPRAGPDRRPPPWPARRPPTEPPYCSLTSTGSSPSTTPTATPPATRFSSNLPTSCAVSSPAAATRSAVSAATSWPSSSTAAPGHRDRSRRTGRRRSARPPFCHPHRRPRQQRGRGHRPPDLGLRRRRPRTDHGP